ncbi:MAG TPA: amidohydrolase family protein [Xanthobacteraceae bacterium]|jgi:predicted TIM-barrel fold metal-dependent hydrolase
MLRSICSFALCFGTVTLLLSGGASAQTPAKLIAPDADNHMHIQTSALSEQLRALASREPSDFKLMDPGMLSPRTGTEALKILDVAGIREGALLSEGYMWTSKRLGIDPALGAKRTREENAYNVDAAIHSNGRLRAFIGINPLWSGAADEIRFWAGKPGVTGLKIHLANSGFDPGSTEDLGKLEAVFDEANALRLPVIIHVRHAKVYPIADASAFINKVLPHIGDTPIQIAHAGGWGGLDQETLDSLNLYAEAIARKAPGTKHLRLDLALVVIDEHTDRALARGCAELMRKIGLNHFVFGSDWPAIYTPAKFAGLLVSQIPLNQAEWNIVFSNPPTGGAIPR